MSPRKPKVAEAAAAYSVEETAPNVVRKNMDMDQRKLDRAKALLGARTETETVDMALRDVLFWHDLDILVGKVAAAGGIEDVFGPGLSAVTSGSKRGPRAKRK